MDFTEVPLRTAAAVVGIVVSMHSVSANGRMPSPVVSSSLTRRIPLRKPNAVSGSAFAESVLHADSATRERAILREISEGNIPSFLRTLSPVELTDQSGASTTIFVMPDYLAIGSDADYLRMPMNLATATAIADEFGFLLPTRKMVNAIYAQSAHHFVPEPLPAGPRMTSTDYYLTHNAMIERQARADAVAPGTLVAGHKKDVVLTNLLMRNPGRIAIYGWHRPTGAPIQPLSTVHGSCYADYSHGIRLVSAMAWRDGDLRPLFDLLRDASIAPALSDEGIIRVAAGPMPATCAATLHAE
jgi:hypothetical protein